MRGLREEEQSGLDADSWQEIKHQRRIIATRCFGGGGGGCLLLSPFYCPDMEVNRLSPISRDEIGREGIVT